MDNEQQKQPPGGQPYQDHYGPGPKNEGDATPIIAALGAVAVLVLCALGAVIVGWEAPPPEPTKSADRGGSRWQNKGEREKSTGVKGPKFGGLIFRPSTGKLKTAGDWHGRIGDLQQKGDAVSIWKAALLYQHRRCPFRDEMTARTLLQQSANMGFGAAWYDLGDMYEKGQHGVEKSLGQALHHYEKAKECGLSNAKKAIERINKKMAEGDY